MNTGVFIIEIIILLAAFTALVFGMLLASPLTFISDYPPEIQERYYRTQHKEATKERLTKLMLIKKLVAVVVFLFLFAWMAHLAGASGFWSAFGVICAYIVIVAAWDTLVLDWILFANVKRIRLPGTEDMDREYHQKLFHVRVLLPVAPIAAVAAAVAALLTVWLW